MANDSTGGSRSEARVRGWVANILELAEVRLELLTIEARIGLQRLERELIEEAVARHKGNLAAAARLLGLTRAQLSYRLTKIRES